MSPPKKNKNNFTFPIIIKSPQILWKLFGKNVSPKKKKSRITRVTNWYN